MWSAREGTAAAGVHPSAMMLHARRATVLALVLSAGITGCEADANVAQDDADLVVGSVAPGQTVTVAVVAGQTFRQLSFDGVSGQIVEVDVRDVRDSNHVQARPVVQLQAGGGAIADVYVANGQVYGRAWQSARVTTSGRLYVGVASRASTSYEVTLRARACDPRRERCVTPPPPPPACTVTEWGCSYFGESAGGTNSFVGHGRTKEEACQSAQALCDQRRPRLGGDCRYYTSAETTKPCP